MKDPKEQINKVLHPPYTGARGELYEILWKYASGGGGEESRIPCDEIDNIITDILKLQAGKCHCSGYPECICEISRKTKSDPHNDIYGPEPAKKLMKDRFSNQEIVNEAMDLASKKCGKKEKSINACTCDQLHIVNSMKTGKSHCSKCHKNINQSELAMQPKQTAEDFLKSKNIYPDCFITKDTGNGVLLWRVKDLLDEYAQLKAK